MAWIGKDGSDGSEGKEDTQKMLGMRMLDLDSWMLPKIPTMRKNFRVEVKPSKKIKTKIQKVSDDYWEHANAFGLVDSIYVDADGTSVLILNVNDKKEAEELINNDPFIKAGEYKVISLNEIKS